MGHSFPELNLKSLPGWIRESVLVLVLILIAFALRQAVHVLLYPDSISYLSFARNILSGVHHGSGITIERYRFPPLYPHIVALFSLGRSNPLTLVETGRQVSIVAGSLTVLPLYMFARRMFSVRVSAYAAFLLILTPEFLYYSGSVLTESLSALIITMCFVLLWHDPGEKNALIHYAALGVLLGLAFLARHASAGFIVLSLFWIIAVKTAAAGQKRALSSYFKWLLPAATILVCFTAVNLPQVIYIHSETGRWSLSGNFRIDPSKYWEHAGRDMRFTVKSESKYSLTHDGTRFIFEEKPRAKGFSSTISVLFKQPVPFLKAYLRTVGGGYLHDTRSLPYPGIILIFALVGILFLFRERRIRESAFLLWMFGGYYLFLALFHNIRDRYMFLVYPVLLVLAGVGAAGGAGLIVKVAARLKISILNQRAADCLIVVIVLIFLLPAGMGLIREVNSAYPLHYYRALNYELSKRIEPGAYVFDRTPHRPFFAGGRSAGAPYDTIERVAEFGRNRGVRYWIVSTDYVPNFRPQYSPLLSRWEDYPKLLVPLAVFESETGRTILFEIIQEAR